MNDSFDTNPEYENLSPALFLPYSATAEEEEISLTPIKQKTIFSNKKFNFGIFIISIIVFLSLLAPLFSKYKYNEQDLQNAYLPPSILSFQNSFSEASENTHICGTDELGRDLWTRVLVGTRISLYVALLAALCDFLFGITYGSVSAYYGGSVDIYMQRFIEILDGIPSLVIITLFITIFDAGIFSMSLAMALSGWTGMARIVRAQVLKIKSQNFISASKLLGSSDFQIIVKHIFPNVLAPILVTMLFSLPRAIFYESFLSFVGLGLQPPHASLGILINDGFNSLLYSPYLMFIPSMVLSFLILGLNFIGDALQDLITT